MKIVKVDMESKKLAEVPFGAGLKEIAFHGTAAYAVQTHYFGGTVFVSVTGTTVLNRTKGEVLDCCVSTSNEKVSSVNDVESVTDLKSFNLIWPHENPDDEPDTEKVISNLTETLGFNIWDLVNDVYFELREAAIEDASEETV